MYAYYTTLNLTNNEVCNVTTTAFAATGGSVSENGTTADCGILFRTQRFLGIGYGEVLGGQSVAGIPDTMGEIGPNHFLELINGGIVVFDRSSGARVAQTGIDDFFRLTQGGTVYPRAGMNDPRIMYDHRAARWYACAKEPVSVSGNQVILAVSRNSDPVGDPSLDWKTLKCDRFLINVATPDGHADFPTLGADDNGLYIGVHGFPGPEGLVVIPKAPLLTNPPTLVVESPLQFCAARG